MKRQITKEYEYNLTKYRAVVYYFDGINLTEIEKILNIGKGTISKWIKKFKEEGDVLQTKEKTGRPSLINNEVEDLINESLKSNPSLTQIELTQIIKEKLKINISKTTVQAYLSNIGEYKLPFQIPLLSAKNREKRVEYAQFHLNDQFSNVIFSDESRFEMNSNRKKIFVFKGDERPRKTKLNPNYSIMVWGAISKRGKISLTFVEDTMNKEKYIEVLNNFLLPSASIVFGNRTWRFQQDNAPCHKAYLVKNWLNENVPKVLWHPPQSPDLNPIEMIWGIMKGYVEKSNPGSKAELKDAIYHAWQKVTKEMCINCIDHVRKNLHLVIKKNGDFIK